MTIRSVSKITNRAGMLLLVVSTSSACTTAGDTNDRLDAGPRKVTVQEWDTVAMISGADIEDTTLHLPGRIVRWNNALAIIDQLPPFVRVFSNTGRPLWSKGRFGEGPGELKNPYALAVANNGNLLVLDAGLMRFNEYTPGGEFVRHLANARARIGGDFTVIPDWIVVTNSNPRISTTYLTEDSLEVIETQPLPWPDSLPRRTRIDRWSAAVPGRRMSWVSGFRMGPGFFVYAEGRPTYHPYIEEVPLVSGRQLSVRFAAHSIDVIGDEVFFLFGGQGLRTGVERPRFVDVYGLDGAYRRSYQLPMEAFHLTTDGSTFYVLQHEPFPAVIILRPKPNEPRRRRRLRGTPRD